MVDTNALFEKMVARAKNFRWNVEDFKRQIAADKSYLFNFSILKDQILQSGTGDPMIGLSREEVLQRVSYKIYFAYKACKSDLLLFGGESPFSNDIYKVYFFSLLSYYLHTTKRIPGKTLRNFVRDHDPLGFNNPDSQEYQSTQPYSLEVCFRKARHRHLSKSNAYYKSPQWSAITKDAEHEWSFYYAMKYAGETAQDTFKRFGNLYNDIDKAIHLTKKDGDKEHLRQGYEKFLSKLKKIEYKNYVELIKAILSHINDNTEYSGLNLYRFERKLQPYRMINEVNGLLTCEPDLENLFLWKTVLLRDISFPKLYEDFALLHYRETELYANEFLKFLQDIVISSCLILDELVEKGTFGDDWENLFRTMMNELAKDILYDPSQLDFSIKEGSQEKFEKLLAAPVFCALCGEAEINFEHFDLYKLPF